MHFIENRTFDEIDVGASAKLSWTLRPEDLEHLAMVTGGANPAHMDAEYRESDDFQDIVTQGLWSAAAISSLLGTELPGPGSRFLGQSLHFASPVRVGDRIDLSMQVSGKTPEGRRVLIACRGINQHGEVVIEGSIEVEAPSDKLRRPRSAPAAIKTHQPGALFRNWIKKTKSIPAVPTAVVHPCDEVSLGGAMQAAAEDMIVPILVGPADKIGSVAHEAGIDVTGVEIVDAPHSHAAAERAVALVRQGRADVLMKGKLHTDELMEPVVDRATGLRTERRMSHIFGLDVPHYSKPIFITDAALNISPDLDTKRDIVQNAVDLAHALGIEKPKVAILSALETVYSKVPSTIDAAALCKMHDRGQITGAVLDGPLAFDNAVSKAAAAAKGIVSEVAGDADILVVPDLEGGNMVAKQLVYLAGAEAAGIVLGARVPIVLTSRADGIPSRLASTAMAKLVAASAGAALPT